jgi:adenylylsulfate kinase-like enzyme
MTDQNINIIFDLIGLYHKARSWNRKNIDNYVEIYIKTDIQKIIQFNKKKIYKNDRRNIIGLSIKAEYPKNPDIMIENNFDRPIKDLSKELIRKLNI